MVPPKTVDGFNVCIDTSVLLDLKLLSLFIGKSIIAIVQYTKNPKHAKLINANS